MPHISSGGMPILAHNEKLFFFKKQVVMIYEIYLRKHYHFSIINSIVILGLKLFKLAHGSSIWSIRKVRVQPLAAEKNVIRNGPLENWWKPGHTVANIMDFGSIIY